MTRTVTISPKTKGNAAQTGDAFYRKENKKERNADKRWTCGEGSVLNAEA